MAVAGLAAHRAGAQVAQGLGPQRPPDLLGVRPHRLGQQVLVGVVPVQERLLLLGRRLRHSHLRVARAPTSSLSSVASWPAPCLNYRNYSTPLCEVSIVSRQRPRRVVEFPGRGEEAPCGPRPAHWTDAQQSAAERLYDELWPILHGKSARWFRYRLGADEVLSVAHEVIVVAVARHDPSRGSLLRYATKSLWHRLRDALHDPPGRIGGTGLATAAAREVAADDPGEAPPLDERPAVLTPRQRQACEWVLAGASVS